MMERLTDKTRNFDGTASSPKSLVIEEGMRKGMPSAYCNAIVTKLADYEDAEEQGMLFRLPCPIGTTVYTVISECEGDFYECYKACFTCCNRNFYIEEMKFDFDFIDSVGEFVFLTREEAEAALKKMQEGKE